MGQLLGLIERIAGGWVPPAHSPGHQGEPLEAAPSLAVLSAPPVPSGKKIPEITQKKQPQKKSHTRLGTSSGGSGESQKIAESLCAACDSPAWLHLLVLGNGKVIQNCGFLSTDEVQHGARHRHGADLLAVVAVPGIEHVLNDKEVAKALAGTLRGHSQPAYAMCAKDWLRRVADLLECSPIYLLEQGFIDNHDMHEQRHQPPQAVAKLIRTNPNWTAHRSRF